jgi:hypothetical protein
LLERDGTAWRDFQSKAFARGDVIENPSLELNLHLRPNFIGNLAEGA